MSFSLSKWITTIKADAEAAVPSILKFFGKAVSEIDALVKIASPVLAVVDPAVLPAVQAADALLDEVYAAVKSMISLPTSGSVNVTISADTARQILQVGSDAEAWLASVGVAVPDKVVAVTAAASTAAEASASTS